MKIYLIRLISNGEIVGNTHFTYESALKELKEFEDDDKNMGYYKPNAYVIEKHISIYHDTDGIFYEREV